MKKVVIAGICIAAAAVLAGGGYGIYKLVKNNGDPVSVTRVSYLNTGWWGGEMPTSGIVTANVSQEVYISSDELIDEVFVKEGDRVRIGDKLLAYDTTLLDLDFDSAKLDVQILELEIKGAENDLTKLKGTTPVNSKKTGDSARAASLSRNEIFIMTAAPQEEGTESEETADTESETEPETETEEEIEPSPLDRIKANKKLTYKTKPYKGTGTKEDPYVFFCKDGATIEASFMNKMLGFNEAGTSRKKGGMNQDGKGCYAVLEIREGDSVAGGFVKSISINGTAKADKAYEPGTTWTFTSEGVTKNVMDIKDPDKTKDDDDDSDDDDIFDDDGDENYTEEELKELIKEKEEEIKDLKLDKEEAELKVKQAERSLDEATQKATINGIVKSVGDPAAGQIDSEAFILINSEEGMYVKGSISELDLDKIKVGTTMIGSAYESGTSFEATITEISEYPETGESFGWNEGNPNVSNYPFMAYIEEPGNLNNYEYAQLTIASEAGASASSIYLEKAYVRSENGQSYVFIADENNRLVKQYVKTGQTLYSTTIEIKEGLDEEDRIAFPYGKNVKEGAKVKTDEDEDEDTLTDESMLDDSININGGEEGIMMDSMEEY